MPPSRRRPPRSFGHAVSCTNPIGCRRVLHHARRYECCLSQASSGSNKLLIHFRNCSSLQPCQHADCRQARAPGRVVWRHCRGHCGCPDMDVASVTLIMAVGRPQSPWRTACSPMDRNCPHGTPSSSARAPVRAARVAEDDPRVMVL